MLRTRSPESVNAARQGAGLVEQWAALLPRRISFVLSLAAMACVVAGDDLSGANVTFTLLYLAPIAFATWFVDLGAGILLSVLSAAASLATDMHTRTEPLPIPVLAWNVAVQLGVFLTQVLVLAKLKAQLLGEQQLARTDPLTQVANRRAFLESARLEIERSRRTLRPITVVYLDVDDFKKLNDDLGHVAGDALLVTIASALRGATRAVDAVGRLGGDEFGLLLPETDGETAEALTGRLRVALVEAARQGGWSVTFSMGAVTFASPPASVDELVSRADQAMYEAKRAGKDGIRFERIPGPALTSSPRAGPPGISPGGWGA